MGLFRRFQKPPLHFAEVKALTSQQKWEDGMLMNKLVIAQLEVRFKYDTEFLRARPV